MGEILNRVWTPPQRAGVARIRTITKRQSRPLTSHMTSHVHCRFLWFICSHHSPLDCEILMFNRPPNVLAHRGELSARRLAPGGRLGLP